MMKSETGAGQVGLMWVVFLIVLVLGLAGFTYIAFKDKAGIEAERDAAKVQEQRAIDRYTEVQEKITAITKVVGFKVDTAIGASSSAATIAERIATLKEQFPDHIAKDAATLDLVTDGIVAAEADVIRKKGELETSFEEQLALRQAAEENINTIEIENQKRISELEVALNDEQQRAQTQQDEDSQRIANLQTQLDEGENKRREAEQKLSAEVEKYEKRINMLDARIMAQAKKLEVLREPDLPDGSVINTSGTTGLVYIDIGKIDGLRRGTKFAVLRYGKGGVLHPKGWIEVRDVEGKSAKCGVLSETDRLDPIVQGDVVVNPHFARNMVKTFFFLGEFPASMNKGFVEQRLKERGAKVGAELDADTDFLVIGEKERGEFAQKLEDMPDYKLDSQLGVQIYRLKELAAYLAY